MSTVLRPNRSNFVTITTSTSRRRAPSIKAFRPGLSFFPPLIRSSKTCGAQPIRFANAVRDAIWRELSWSVVDTRA